MDVKKKEKRRRNTPDQEEDRISQLPDVILHYILSFMPLKTSTRTCILSRRWKDVWKDSWACTTSLDFGVEFIRSFRFHQNAVRDIISRYLQLHRIESIETFRLSLRFFAVNDIDRFHRNRWVKFAIKKRVRELDLDFRTLHGFCEVPTCLFTYYSLTILKLVWCEFDGYKLETMLLNCHVLEKLTITNCVFKKLKLSSQLLKLKNLTLSSDIVPYLEFEICVPNLLSFHFRGYLGEGDPFNNFSSLEDAIVVMPFIIRPDGRLHQALVRPGVRFRQARVLPAIAHVEILTACNFSLFDFVGAITDEEQDEKLPTVFPNLRELQLVLSLTDDQYLNAVYAFFKHFTLPCLEKLFIEILSEPRLWEDLSNEAAELGPTESHFYHLKKIKINRFSGSKFEMQLVKFLLEKAIRLESLALTPARRIRRYSAKKASTSQTEPNASSKLSLHQQLLLLPKASLNAQIILYKYPKQVKNLRPRHDAQAGDLLKDLGNMLL